MVSDNKSRKRPVMWLLAGLLPLLPAHAATLSCPEMVKVVQQLEAPEGWEQVALGDQVELSEVLLHDGRPEEGVTMMADEESSDGGEWVQRWLLPENPRGYWLVCRYQGSLVALSRELPQTLEQCEVAYDRGARFTQGSLPRRAECR